MNDYDEEFGQNRTPVCSECGERLAVDEIFWCEEKDDARV